jgi:hypothetical protein
MKTTEITIQSTITAMTATVAAAAKQQLRE